MKYDFYTDFGTDTLSFIISSKVTKKGLELIPKLREKQNELLQLIDFAKDKL